MMAIGVAGLVHQPIAQANLAESLLNFLNMQTRELDLNSLEPIVTIDQDCQLFFSTILSSRIDFPCEDDYQNSR